MREQWQLPVAQVQGYAKDAGCRYGFILSDAHLVILRFSPKPVNTVNVNTRPRPELNNQRIASDSTNTSSRFASMSIDSPSEYIDSVANLDYNDPDYVTIPWTSWGKGHLTIRLGLFFICLMAGTGNATVHFTYPELDSWMPLGNGSFMHNTSGEVASKLPRGARLIELEDDSADDGGEAGPSQSQHSKAGPSQVQHTGTGPSQAAGSQHTAISNTARKSARAEKRSKEKVTCQHHQERKLNLHSMGSGLFSTTAEHNSGPSRLHG